MKDLIDTYNRVKKLYEKAYDIHICQREEIEEVLSFIDNYWQKDHILTKSRILLEWQHYDEKNNQYNFVLAKSRTSGEIHGIIGFILSSMYDTIGIQTPIRWGAIWKVREDVAVKGLGLVLKGYLETTVPVHYIGGVGLSKYSKAIDQKLGETMGKLSQYYIANPYIKEFELMSNPKFVDKETVQSDAKKKFIRLLENEFCEMVPAIKRYIMPYKSVNYYVNRYYRHPLYDYGTVGIFDEESITAVFIYRKCTSGNRSSIFIVDYVGAEETIAGCYDLFLDFIQKEEAEYICFPCSGISDIWMRKAGFVLREETDTVLPVYYEPFVKKNVDLDYHFWTDQNYTAEIIVKGDADQDRPNRLPEVVNDKCDRTSSSCSKRKGRNSSSQR